SYGLWCAARQDPLWISPDQVPGLICSALYRPVTTPRPDPQMARQIIHCAREAMAAHMSDDTDQFNSWFLGPHNSFVGHLAKKMRVSGVELDPAEIHAVLFDQGWYAYRQVADCVQAMLQCFKSVLPVQLTEVESQQYDRMHTKQLFFGNFPYVLLAER